MPFPNIDDLTPDETKVLAIECLAMLPLDMKVQAVLQAFPADDDDRGELLAWLTD